MRDMDYVEVKRCDHNGLQVLTIKIRADKQHYLLSCLDIPTRRENIVNF